MASTPRLLVPVHVALVADASRGIGRAIVEPLEADGSRVVTGGRGARPAYLPGDVGWVGASRSTVV